VNVKETDEMRQENERLVIFKEDENGQEMVTEEEKRVLRWG